MNHKKTKNYFQSSIGRAGEMAQQLSTLAALALNLSSVPSTNTGQLTTTCDSPLGDLIPSSGLHRHLKTQIYIYIHTYTHTYTYTYTQTHKYIHISNKSSKIPCKCNVLDREVETVSLSQ